MKGHSVSKVSLLTTLCSIRPTKDPLIRGDDGELHETTWEEALDKAAEGYRKVQAEHGRYSIYGVASGRAPSEAAYLMQKFIRVGVRDELHRQL